MIATMGAPDGATGSVTKWTTLPYHRLWLVKQASSLFEFFEPHSIDLAGGFVALDNMGQTTITLAGSSIEQARQSSPKRSWWSIRRNSTFGSLRDGHELRVL